MTTTQPLQPPQQGEQTLAASLASLTHLSTLWVPLEETIGQWATFAHEALTVSTQQAVSIAFGGLAWESKALRHYTFAVYERGRPRKEAHWLKHAVQDLDCALDQWQQAVSWLELAGNDDYQPPEQTSLETMRHLLEQVTLHQERRRALHRQVLGEYASPTGRTVRREGETMVTAELLGMTIVWLLVAIVISLLLWLLVLIWGQLIQAIKTWFGVSREELSQPQDHYQVPGYPPLQQDGYSRRDFQ